MNEIKVNFQEKSVEDILKVLIQKYNSITI